MSNQHTPSLPLAPALDARRVYLLNHEGVEFQLFSDGVLTARVRKLDEQPTVVERLTKHEVDQDFAGNAWIPKHKNFNSWVKWGVREGDYDEFYKRKSDHEKRMASIRKAAPDMLEALQLIVDDHEFCGDDHGDRREAWMETARNAISKAEGKA